MKHPVSLFFVLLAALTFLPLLASRPLVRSGGTNTIILHDEASDKTSTLSREEFLTGAVLAQTDPTYHEEALKAQAVVAYTNALYLREKNADKEYDLLTTQMPYLAPDMAQETYGNKICEKVNRAVKAVDKLVLQHQNRVILAPFFPYGTAMTETAATVWGEDIPYLQPVKSEGDRLSPGYSTTVVFALSDLRQRLQEKYPTLDTDDLTVTIPETTESQTVKALTVGSLSMTGQEFRALMGLKSAAFSVKQDENNLTVTCYGNGHLVGLSLYGADFYARQGMSYEEILKHYYTDITLTVMG